MKSECWLSFSFVSALLFQIISSQDTTINQQDGDNLTYPQEGTCVTFQHCGETSPSQSVCEQNFSPSLTSNDLIQLQGENCPANLTLKTEVPKVVEASEIEHSMEGKIGIEDSSNENSTRNIKSSRKYFVWNVVAPQTPFLSKSKQEKAQTHKGISNSLTGLAKKMMISSRYNPPWNVSVPQVASVSRSKREITQNSPRKNNTLPGLQKIEEIFKVDQSLEALLRKIIVDHMYGCDLIIIYDVIYKETRSLETLVNMPFIKQVQQLVSVEDLSDMIQWESQNCLGTMLLMSDPEFLISFGGINRFLWAYQAKVIIVGLELHSLEKFLKTVKGKKTEHVIGVVEDPINHNFEVYMNLLFWGEGMKLLTDWSDNRFTKRADLFPDKITDLRNTELNAFIFEYRPVSFYEYAPNRTIIRRHGRFVSIVRNLAEKFNFTINFIEVENAFGYRLENGSFIGMPGNLERDEGHFGLPYFYQLAQENRHRVYDYSRYIEDDRLCFLVAREAPRPAWESLGLPFTPESWIAVISGIFLSGPIFYLLVMASTSVGEEYINFKSLSYSSLFAIGIQIDHPLVSMPKRLCNQIFITFLLIYSLILTTGYRSNLISFLTVARPPREINTIKELAESGLQVYGLEWVIPALENSGDQYLKKLLDRFEIRFSIEEFIEEFMEGKGAALNGRFLLEGRSTLMTTKTGKSVTRFLKECVGTYMGSMIYQWHSPLNPRFNKVIANLVESGITRHWVLELNEEYKKFVEREGSVIYFPDVWRDDKDDLIPLGISHLTGIWVSLVIGYLLATVSFAVEVIGYKEILL